MTGYGMTLAAWNLYDAAKRMFAASNALEYANAVRYLRDAVMAAEDASDPTSEAEHKKIRTPPLDEMRRAQQGAVETVLLKDAPARSGGKL